MARTARIATHMPPEAVTDYLDSWQNIAQCFRQFRACDDGGIAEGISDAVARLLANRWDRLWSFLAAFS